MSVLNGDNMTLGECLAARAAGHTINYARKKKPSAPHKVKTTLQERYSALFVEHKADIAKRKGNRDRLSKLVSYIGKLPKGQALAALVELALVEGQGGGLLTLQSFVQKEVGQWRKN